MVLKLKKDGDWVRVLNSDANMSKFIKHGINPSTYRKFDLETREWRVHYTKIHTLVLLAKRIYVSVDWSHLPEEWQMLAVGARTVNPGAERPPQKSTKKGPDSYSALFLLPTAPFCVVKASYKALAMEYHPDRGGDAVKFRKLVDAFDILRTKFGG